MKSRVQLSRLMLITAAIAATTGSQLAAAADPVPPPPPAAARDKLTKARDLVKTGSWPEAIDELKRVNDRRSADWHNLMGFAHRKLATPDLAAAARHYDEALRIKPDHLGALEYAGELHLMQGDLPRAEARLQALSKACPQGCEELEDLKAGIAKFKANGNRWQP